MNLFVYISDEKWNREDAWEAIDAWLWVNGIIVSKIDIIKAFDPLREKYQSKPRGHFKIPGHEVVNIFMDFLFGRR